MVAIAKDHETQLLEVVGRRVEVSILVHDEQTEPVGGLEKLGRGRIMGGAVGVGAHLLQPANAEIPERGGHGHAHARMVLVVAGAFELEWTVVEEKAQLGIEAYGAEPAARLDRVGFATVVQHGYAHGVERGLVDRPEPG